MYDNMDLVLMNDSHCGWCGKFIDDPKQAYYKSDYTSDWWDKVFPAIAKAICGPCGKPKTSFGAFEIAMGYGAICYRCMGFIALPIPPQDEVTCNEAGEWTCHRCGSGPKSNKVPDHLTTPEIIEMMENKKITKIWTNSPTLITAAKEHRVRVNEHINEKKYK